MEKKFPVSIYCRLYRPESFINKLKELITAHTDKVTVPWECITIIHALLTQPISVCLNISYTMKRRGIRDLDHHGY